MLVQGIVNLGRLKKPVTLAVGTHCVNAKGKSKLCGTPIILRKRQRSKLWDEAQLVPHDVNFFEQSSVA